MRGVLFVLISCVNVSVYNSNIQHMDSLHDISHHVFERIDGESIMLWHDHRLWCEVKTQKLDVHTWRSYYCLACICMHDHGAWILELMFIRYLIEISKFTLFIVIVVVVIDQVVESWNESAFGDVNPSHGCCIISCEMSFI